MNKAERKEELDAVKLVADEVLRSQPKCLVGFNYGYLWAVAKIDGRNMKFLVGGSCPASWVDAEVAVTKAVKEIEYTYVNMD
jgi:hypothetical protein